MISIDNSLIECFVKSLVYKHEEYEGNLYFAW